MKLNKKDKAMNKTNEPAEKKARLQALLDGADEAPNPYAAFIVQQLRITFAQGQQIAQQLQAAKAQLRALEEHAIKLEGAAEQYLRDLDTWDKVAEATSASEVPTTPAPVKNGQHEQIQS